VPSLCEPDCRYVRIRFRHQLTYCRLLNHLPATRLTATALEAFLRVAGFALWRAYRGQFVKLLHLVDQSFLAALQQVYTSVSRV
jgi:GLE1-like protein